MLRSAMLLRVAMEPLTAGSIVAVCDCYPALQPPSAAAAISTQMAAAAQARGSNEFTMFSDRLELAGQRSSIRATPQSSLAQGGPGVV
jgi:hypothetical protein